MSEITKAIGAKQTQISQLQREIGTLQRAASVLGGEAKAQPKAQPKKRRKKAAKAKPARAKAPAKAKAKSKAKPQATAPKGKRHQWTAAEKAAIGKRMKAFWAKRRKPTTATTTAPAQPKATQKRTRKPWSAAAKKAMSKRIKASWAKRRRLGASPERRHRIPATRRQGKRRG